ncbi:hypothetical protein BDB00DRAFT_933049 [Zychaea mexicana]|uniref:uncharacterized protein n=1 Tax=Zychaea mexicana TaxID=64656 RepID=UPI0022FE5E58|nr:uncharacterized protein BDB00DRAFT_933049 [Zychaea mexicana]KAI9487977.1 hypothetical protein BDB00DRAFT_933049 [Zychaea mexicana]
MSQKYKVTMETVEDTGEPMIRDGSKPTFDLDVLGHPSHDARAPSEEENLSWKEVDKMEEKARQERQNSQDEQNNAHETAQMVDDFIRYRK